ncbi:MAG: 50S ribosomal protein L22 [Phycisphaerales bacterium]|nr:MAG: 50S ribosomal protein L22 [Phycisphaerales bacterium]
MDVLRTWMAKHRFARVAPRKARIVIDTIRGRRCDEAMEQLRYNPRRSAVFIRDVLKAAMVNADEAEADMSRLYVKEARVDGGPYYRRWRPKDRGRVHPIAKRTSHIVLVLAES